MELPPLAEFQMMVKIVNPRLLTSSSTRSWMELSPLIKFEMVAKASSLYVYLPTELDNAEH